MPTPSRAAWLVPTLAALSAPLAAQTGRDEVVRSVEARHAHYAGIARQIWALAEVGFEETRSSALLPRPSAGALRSTGWRR